MTHPSRRDFLRVSGLAVAGTALATATPAYATGIDYTARQTFDDWDRLFQQGGPGQPDQPNDNTNADGRSGMLAWSQSYVLLGLVRMYETYRDTYYLDRLVENIDQVLSVRDSVRGVTDYRGLSLPAWRADHPYTTGYTTLADSNGHPLLEVRQALPYAEDTTVSVLMRLQRGQVHPAAGQRVREPDRDPHGPLAGPGQPGLRGGPPLCGVAGTTPAHGARRTGGWGGCPGARRLPDEDEAGDFRRTHGDDHVSHR